MSFEFDIDHTSKGWIGTAAIPSMNASGIPLSDIALTDGKWTFHIKAGTGDPSFSGTLSADGQTLTGTFGQGGITFPFTLKRTGDPRADLAKTSPAVAKEFVGTWEGTLNAAAQPFRLVLKISNEADGAKAVFTSLDQGNSQIPVGSIEQKDSKLTLHVTMIGGDFQGEINKDGTELNGTWTQMGASLPLVLKKSAERK